MSQGRLLDHHWVERTLAGQAAWRNSSMPPPERGLLNALRTPMKVSELYRRSQAIDPQVFLNLVNDLSRRGWVARLLEPGVDRDVPSSPIVVPLDTPVPIVVAPLAPASASRPPVEPERTEMSHDLRAMLERYRGERERVIPTDEKSLETPIEPEPPTAPSMVDDAQRSGVPTTEATIVADLPFAPSDDVMPEEERTAQDTVAPPVVEQTDSRLLDVPAMPIAPSPRMAEPATLPAPVIVQDKTAVIATDTPIDVVMPLPSNVPAELAAWLSADEDMPPAPAVTPAAAAAPAVLKERHDAPAVAPASQRGWTGMTSLSALEKALSMDGDTTPSSSPMPVANIPETSESNEKRPLSAPANEAPTRGQAKTETTQQASSPSPWSRPGALDLERALSGLAPLNEARASDLGPASPPPSMLEDEEDLMRSLTRPRRLSVPGKTSSRAVPGKAKNEAFAQQVRQLQAMKNETEQQKAQRQGETARIQAEKEFQQMSEQARRESMAALRAEAQQREESQSLLNLADRMKRMKKRDRSE